MCCGDCFSCLGTVPRAGATLLRADNQVAVSADVCRGDTRQARYVFWILLKMGREGQPTGGTGGTAQERWSREHRHFILQPMATLAAWLYPREYARWLARVGRAMRGPVPFDQRGTYACVPIFACFAPQSHVSLETPRIMMHHHSSAHLHWLQALYLRMLTRLQTYVYYHICTRLASGYQLTQRHAPATT